MLVTAGAVSATNLGALLSRPLRLMCHFPVLCHSSGSFPQDPQQLSSSVPAWSKGPHTLQAPACHPEVSGHSKQLRRNLHFSAPSLHRIHVMIGSGKLARVWKSLILKEISPCREPFLKSGQDSLGIESRNVGCLLAKEAPRLPAQKGGITGMFGGSKLCHCEIGTNRIRSKP